MAVEQPERDDVASRMQPRGRGAKGRQTRVDPPAVAGAKPGGIRALNLRLPYETIKHLKQHALERDEDASAIVKELIETHLTAKCYWRGFPKAGQGRGAEGDFEGDGAST